MDLVAPLVDRETALAITWGGAAACRDCKLQREHLERETGVVSDTCYRTKGACAFPAPEPDPHLAGLWNTWKDATEAVKRAGMDGEPDGRDLASVQIIARAHGEVIDATFLRYWRVLTAAERAQVRRKAASRPSVNR